MAAIAAVRSSLIFFSYLAARILGAPILLLYFLYRGLRDRRYFQHFRERLGVVRFRPTPPGSIWLHAVSVGEAIAAARVMEELRRANPRIPLFLSISTLAGREVALRKASPFASGIFFAPIDYAFAVRRVLRSLRPAVVAILETEIWPVWWKEVERRGIALLVLNGRISDRALPRYRRLRFAFEPVLALPSRILAQSERDRQRFIDIGAPADRAFSFGNLKYDAAPSRSDPPEIAIRMLGELRPEQVWIAASTMPPLDASDIDEDDLVIAAFLKLRERFPRLLLILAPRKPERFATAAAKLRDAGVSFIRRTDPSLAVGAVWPWVLLLDSIGELASLFQLADVVFVGGTMARRGGHNVLEPAVCGKPIVVGPHMENFEAIAAEFRSRLAWREMNGPEGLETAIAELLANPLEREDLGRRAAEVASLHTGVAARAAGEILAAHDLAVPLWNSPGPTRAILWLLARLWKIGNRVKQDRNARAAGSLDRPVISIGGISMGGTGKTPLTGMLAAALHKRGFQPAILTRGYRRRSLHTNILVQAGTLANPSLTGDEAQIYLRAGHAHLAIGADRHATGRMLSERLSPDVFLLDDGFQHRRVKRDLDIVAIDALNPFAGGEVFPLGFLREPLEGLARAHAFVITRVQSGRDYTGIRQTLRRWNPGAPIFTASVRPVGWMRESSQQASAAPSDPVAAFCGLANPGAFWQTLEEEGFHPVLTWTFGDHHAYRQLELRRLAHQAKSAGATALLTTEKDAINLPADAETLCSGLPIYWLKIETVVQEEAEFMALVESAIRDQDVRLTETA